MKSWINKGSATFRDGNSRSSGPHRSFPTSPEESFEPHSKAQHKAPGAVMASE